MTQATLWAVAASLLVALLAAIAAKALRVFSRQRLQLICRKRKLRSRFKDILLRRDDVELAVETLQVLATAVLVCASSYYVWLRSGEGNLPGLTTLLASAALGGLLLLAVEIWLPKAIANLWPEAFLFYTWRLWKLATQAMTPLVWAAAFVDGLMHRLAGRQKHRPTEEFIEEEIRTIVTEGHRQGLLEEDAREMIEGVIQLGDADVADVMTPRTDMVSLQVNVPLSDALKFVVRCGHTRIPVYDRNRDDIVGVLYAKDLLPELLGDRSSNRPLKEILREPFFVPETKRVDDLLQEFQRTRNHMAIVLDEYGGVSGLVTIEDVLEEIVGEIVDEYDTDLVEGVKRIDDRTAEALAKTHIDEINDRLNLSIPDDGEFDTIGGFVFSELGRVPSAGDELLWDNLRITVLEATRRRIERVRIEQLAAEEKSA